LGAGAEILLLEWMQNGSKQKRALVIDIPSRQSRLTQHDRRLAESFLRDGILAGTPLFSLRSDFFTCSPVRILRPVLVRRRQINYASRSAALCVLRQVGQDVSGPSVIRGVRGGNFQTD
jgi:hypothetical protein